jgi:hypothetical protein
MSHAAAWFGLKRGVLVAGLWLLASALAGSACRSTAAPPAAMEQASTAADGVARVGPLVIRAAAVQRIAEARGLTPRQALDAAIADALLELAAREQWLDRSLRVQQAVRASHARALLAALDAEVRAGPPASSSELEGPKERRWLDVARDPSMRTVHAVAIASGEAPEAERQKARALRATVAERVRSAASVAASTTPPVPIVPWVAPDADPAAVVFLAEAKAVSSGPELVAEVLAPVTKEGRTVAVPAGGFHPSYAEAAHKLVKRGDLIEADTPFGFHIIMLLDSVPGSVAGERDLERRLRPEVLRIRAAAQYRQLVGSLRKGALELVDGVDALLSTVGETMAAP